MTKRCSLFAFALALAALGAACARPASQDAPPPAPAAQPAPAPAPAPTPTPAPAPAAAKAETATFQVPGLDADTVAKLTAALADKPGVVSAKADQVGATYAVTFAPGQNNPDGLLKALQAVKPEISLKGVASAAGDAAPPPGHDCGGCPYHDTCGKN